MHFGIEPPAGQHGREPSALIRNDGTGLGRHSKGYPLKVSGLSDSDRSNLNHLSISMHSSMPSIERVFHAHGLTDNPYHESQ